MKKVYVLNPTNESELDKFSTLDIDREKTKKEFSNSTEVYRVLYTLLHFKVDDYCTLDLMTDLKNCVLNFPTMDQAKRKRPFINQAVSFARDLGAEEVLVIINPDDKKTKKILEEDFEYSAFPLDQEDKKVLFVHENSYQDVNSRVI